MKEIEPSTLRSRLASGEPVLIVDVRSEEEFRAGHVPGAVHHPLDEILADPGLLPLDRPLVTVCGKGGGRSASAAETLSAAGASDVAPLTGGTLGWRDAGLPLDEEV